jgi:hypothetical protein
LTVPSAEITLELQGGSFLDSSSQRAGLLLLLSMLLSFGFIRFSTRMIRAEVSWWPGNVTPGGLHIHHLVFGIVLLMVAGFVEFALSPDSPWLEIVAVIFGVGAGLTLDEFALWLYLEDVYWAEEGRRSVDAVILAALIGGALLMGFVPLDAGGGGTALAAVVTILVGLTICTVVALKGKYASAVVGILIAPVAWVTAIRLGLPGSWWAKRRYPAGSGKLAKAEARKERHDRRYRWLQDLIGGRPSQPDPGPASSHNPD